jgi:hypothetical protein
MRWRRLAGGLVAALCVGGAGCRETPERVGDRFVDLYFVEIDQARARPLTSGLALRKLEDELRLVEGVRRTYTPDQAKPSVYWERLGGEVVGATPGERHARESYEVRIRQGSDETRRSVLLTLEERGGRWTVSNFTVEETAPPARR